MKGKLYGVGTGPGDPELLTIKALRLIKEADLIVVPGEQAESSVAYQIVQGIYPEIAEKDCMAVSMPMIKERILLEEAHDRAAGVIKEELEKGKTIAFLTLGDPTVYSTYMYVHKRIANWGYETEIVNGIPSFCAVAAKINTSLVENHEPLHVIPATYQMEDAFDLNGTKVFMKAGKKLGEVKKRIIQSGAEAVMIENCGMPGEKIYHSAKDIPEQAGYYSLIIMKDKQNR